jgi:hypothetical protein
VIFIITLVKKNLRITYWVPVSFISCMAFLVLAALMFIGPSIMQPQFVEYPGSEVGSATEETAETKPAQGEQEETQKLKTYDMGDTIELGDLVIKVNGIRTAEKEEWAMLEEGYIYLLVDISIENTGNKEAYLDTYMNFRLVDRNGRNYKFIWAEEAKGRVEGNLGAGRKIAGELCYGIPSDIKEFEIEISDPNPGMLGTEMVIINIQLEE